AAHARAGGVALDRAGPAQAQLQLDLRVDAAALGAGHVAPDGAAARQHEALRARAVGDVDAPATPRGTVADRAAHDGTVAQHDLAEVVDAAALLGLVVVHDGRYEDQLALVAHAAALPADVADDPRPHQRQAAAVRDAAAGGGARRADVAADRGVDDLHDPLVQHAGEPVERLVVADRAPPHPHEAGVRQAADGLGAVRPERDVVEEGHARADHPAEHEVRAARDRDAREPQLALAEDAQRLVVRDARVDHFGVRVEAQRCDHPDLARDEGAVEGELAARDGEAAARV